MTNKKLTITDEVRANLAGLLPMRNDTVIAFTPAVFEGIDEKYRPVFSLTPLMQREVVDAKTMGAKFMSNGLGDNAVAEVITARNVVLSDHLVGWSNLINLSTSEDVEFSRGNIGLLPDGISQSIYDRVLEISGFRK